MRILSNLHKLGSKSLFVAKIEFHFRDFIRSLLGNDVVFIVLGMTLECSQKRVEKRHGDIDGVGDFASKLHKFYAPAGEDEPNSYNVSIEQGMSRDDVLAKVIDEVNKSQS